MIQGFTPKVLIPLANLVKSPPIRFCQSIPRRLFTPVICGFTPGAESIDAVFGIKVK